MTGMTRAKRWKRYALLAVVIGFVIAVFVFAYAINIRRI